MTPFSTPFWLLGAKNGVHMGKFWKRIFMSIKNRWETNLSKIIQKNLVLDLSVLVHDVINVYLRILHYIKSVRTRSCSDPYFPAFGLNTERYEVSLHIYSKCRKIRTSVTPNTDTFHAVLQILSFKENSTLSRSSSNCCSVYNCCSKLLCLWSVSYWVEAPKKSKSGKYRQNEYDVKFYCQTTWLFIFIVLFLIFSP